MEEEIGKLSIEMDSNNLFKETVYTDRKSGSIKMLEKLILKPTLLPMMKNYLLVKHKL